MSTKEKNTNKIKKAPREVATNSPPIMTHLPTLGIFVSRKQQLFTSKVIENKIKVRSSKNPKHASQSQDPQK